jgi:hypothetical protein
MPLYRVQLYGDERYATRSSLCRRTEARQFDRRAVRRHDAPRLYSANHAREFPAVVRVEQAASCFNADEPFAPVVESVDAVQEPVQREI